MDAPAFPDTLRTGRFAVPVLYMDNHILVAVKPANMLSQSDATGDMDMLTLLKAYVGRVYNKPGSVYLGLVHRLDRPVGGVMVFARTSKAASRLSAQFSGHSAVKKYLAVAQGDIPRETQLRDFLLKDEATGMVRAVPPDTPGAKEARLLTRPIARRAGTTLTEVTLFTGRSHQIRVQHMNAGFPLWGDARYGGGQPGQQIALWAYSLTFEHPTLKTRETYSFLPSGGIWDTYAPAMEKLS